MIYYAKQYKIHPPVGNRQWILEKAEAALKMPPLHITDAKAHNSAGGIHDYYSNADYWWPNPDTVDGFPYVQRDGQTNPDNFNQHRFMLRRTRTNLCYLAAAYRITGEKRYAEHGLRLVQEFFLDPKTRMNPNLAFAQAIPGVCSGRGIGIIDTLHLADVTFAVEALKDSSFMTESVYCGMKEWFAQYLGWMLTDKNGIDEMNTTNNHSICFFMQAAAFALFTDNEKIADFCRWQYKTVLLHQMDLNGSFPRELKRTKPYSYSIFALDNMVSLCQLLSRPEDDLWEYTAPDGRSIRKGLEFITPYVLNKSLWNYPVDVMHFESFPARASFMLFAGCRFGMQELLDLYESLPFESDDEEARRNVAVRQPMLWM